jgi:hypothetical protein
MVDIIQRGTIGRPNFIVAFYYEAIKEVAHHYLEYSGKHTGYTAAAVGQWKIKYKENA